METENDRLLEPCESYEKFYKSEFQKNAEELFEKLLKESQVPVDENRRLAEQYRKTSEEAKTLGKKLSRMKALRIFLIVLAVIGAGLLIFGITQGVLLLTIIPPIVSVASLLLIFLVCNKKIKALQASFNETDAKAKKLYVDAMLLIEPLLQLFDSGMARELIQKTVPTLVIDKNYDMRRFDYLNGKYGYPEDDGEEISMLGVMSGEIIGNPFIFEKKLKHTWGMQTYTGSLTIHWTTHEYVNGKMETRHHTEVLHASVQKPKPFFTKITDLVYGNEAAPDLTFSRFKTHAENFSERKLKSFTKSRIKKLKKIAKERIDQGFTELGNDEFDGLFGAFDRDHEVQFRLLFTPLAQQNLLKIIKDKPPFGDDFDFYKRKCINIVKADHMQEWNFDVPAQEYFSYDVDLCKEAFLKVNGDYFEAVYFNFAPLLSIPMYQQHKPHEYIYKDSYTRNYTVRETEVMANLLGQKALAHPLSVTPAILKTRLDSTSEDVDQITVNALSYRTVNRVDFVPVFGGDGRFHNVPVPWLLYVPLHQETEVELKSLDMSDREFRSSDYADDDDRHVFRHSIFATLGKIIGNSDDAPDEEDQDISEYGKVQENEEILNTVEDEFDDDDDE